MKTKKCKICKCKIKPDNKENYNKFIHTFYRKSKILKRNIEIPVCDICYRNMLAYYGLAFKGARE